ncbi:MAG: UDP-3-O-(3-hydroxymyristoyl)glucosamine N-acyltransferase [Bacteroidota bacterium]
MKCQPPITLEAVAHFLNCTYVGNPEHLIYGINEIHRVETGDLTFVDVEKYYTKALHSDADTILINQLVDPPEGKALLVSKDPFTDYNLLTEWIQPTSSLDVQGEPKLGKDVRIGHHVVFGQDVEIAEGVEIGHHVVIGSHVRIGKGSKIHSNVTLYDHVYIGEEVCINAGTVIGSEAFYFKTRPHGRDKMLTKGSVIIEDHVDIGANCTIDRGVSADTIIGAWTKLDNLIQIGHDTRIGKRCLIASQVGIAGVVDIEDDVILWGQVGINKDLRIGAGAQLYGKTGVMSDLKGKTTYLGMIATDARQKLREIAAIKKLPEMIKDWEKWRKNK